MNTLLSILLLATWMNRLLFVLLVLVCLGALSYLVDKAPLISPTIKSVLKWVILIVSVLFLINYLFSLLGHGINF